MPPSPLSTPNRCVSRLHPHIFYFYARNPPQAIVDVAVVSHIQRIGCQPEKLLYTVANPASGLLNREKRTKEEVWQHPPPPPPPPTQHTARSEKNTKMKITRRIYRRYAGLGRSLVRTRISSARRLGTRPREVASQNSTLPCATTSFPVSLLLSSPGDV